MSSRDRSPSPPAVTWLRGGPPYRLLLHSRGDRLAARLLGVERASQSRPLLVVAAPDGRAESPWVDAAASAVPWAAVLGFDLPLCGSRASEKLSPLAFDPNHPLAARLAPDLRQQLASDVACATCAMSTEPWFQAASGLLALGFAAAMAADACLHAKLRAVVLADHGGAPAPPPDLTIPVRTDRIRLAEPDAAWLEDVGRFLRPHLLER